jgi:hypothetical protein
MTQTVINAIPNEASEPTPVSYGVLLKKVTVAWRTAKAKAKTMKHLITRVLRSIAFHGYDYLGGKIKSCRQLFFFQT